jgi:hypothetical protein
MSHVHAALKMRFACCREARTMVVMNTSWICVTCGVEYPPAAARPAGERDDRHRQSERWRHRRMRTTSSELRIVG